MLMFIVHWHRIVIQIQIYSIRSEYRQQDESKEIERIVYCHHYYPYSGSTKFSQFKLKILLELCADFLHLYAMLCLAQTVKLHEVLRLQLINGKYHFWCKLYYE